MSHATANNRQSESDLPADVATVREAAALSNVQKWPATLRWWIHMGYLETLRLPGSRRFHGYCSRS